MHFGLVAFNGMEELDLVGPWEMLQVWSRKFAGPEHVFIVSEWGGEIHCAKGMKIHPDYHFHNCPPLDFMLVPGGFGTNKEMHNEVMVNFVRDQARNCKHVLSVCSGAFILHAAGLLEGKKAITYWDDKKNLAGLGVQIEDKRYVKDGNVWTAAGVSAGIDLALAFIAEIAGEEVAGNVQLYTEYYPDQKVYGNPAATDGAPTYISK